MEDLYEKASYERALSKIERIKSLYMHLLSFFAVNFLTLLCKLIGFGLHPMVWDNCLIGTAVVGFIGLTAHAAVVYGPSILKKKGWEERKMQELVEKERRKKNTNYQK